MIDRKKKNVLITSIQLLQMISSSKKLTGLAIEQSYEQKA